ncbi:MAG: ECF transporter S component [Peptoniphilus sp.]|nr:ECF transporter S component [Peptoniphilus sp.]MDY6044388.1 ECF transporter S component [Peptoniphilus sp.]
MQKLSTRQLTVFAMFIALTTVATIAIQIPIPSTHGYVNIGDTLLICAGLLMGKAAGGIVGGLGSALADLLTGYTFYAPITLVVKGLEGFIAGILREKTSLPLLVCAIASGVVMACGYLVAETFILYNFPTALASFVPNIVQGLAGSVLASILYPLLAKAPLFREFTENE